MGSVHFLYPDQVPDSVDHATELRTVRLDDGLADAVQAQRPQRVALRAVAADLRLDLGHLELCHLVCPLPFTRSRRRWRPGSRRLGRRAWPWAPRARSAGRAWPRSPPDGSGPSAPPRWRAPR